MQVSYSKFKHELAKALERAGLVSGVERRGKRVRKTLEVSLFYREKIPVISELKLISKPGRRIYVAYQELKTGHGSMVFLSTSKGVLSGSEARKAKVGGELLVEIK